MSNYTEDMTSQIIQAYLNDPSRECVELLGMLHNRSLKSIIGKLSREGVYQREAYKTKAGEKPITKIELVHQIADSISVDPEDLRGLDKAPKQALKFLKTHL